MFVAKEKKKVNELWIVLLSRLAYNITDAAARNFSEANFFSVMSAEGEIRYA